MMCKMLGVLLTSVLCLGDVPSRSFRVEEGPFQTKIVNASSCVTPPVWFSSNISAYSSKGRSLIRGLVTSKRHIKDSKFRVLMYYLEEKKVKVFDMKNQNCHNAIIEVILMTIAMPFNKQNCNIKAGTYEFQDLNMDAILHTVVQTLWYGNAQLRLEGGTRNHNLLCLDLHFEIYKPSANAP